MFTAPLPLTPATPHSGGDHHPGTGSDIDTAPGPVSQHSTSPRRRWAALAVLMLPVLLVAVDNTVLSFALPSISEALHPTGNQLLWLVDVYPLVLAGLLVPMGSTGDRIGRRRILLIGATGFTVFSAAAAFAPTAAWLVATRAAMGFFGAMIMPATLSLIRNIFTDPHERRMAIAVWAAGFSGGAALGPVVGGFLLEHFAWGSVFLLAVPVLLPLLVLGPVLVPESRDPRPGPVDPVSILLVMATMAPLVYGIKAVSTHGVGYDVVVPLLVAGAAGVCFVRRQLHRPEPMLDVRLFTNPVFAGAVGANLLSVFSLVGFLYYLSQHLQLVSGMSPMLAGVALLPGLAVTILAGLLAVRLVRRWTRAQVVAFGIGLEAAGFALAAFSAPRGTDEGLLVAFSLMGAGIGLAETISNDLILEAVPTHRAGAASAISETAYETGAVLGTAVLGSVLNAAYRGHLSIPEGVPEEAARTARETLGGATEVARGLGEDLGGQLLGSAQAAFDAGAVLTSWTGAVVMVVAGVVSVITLRRR